MLYMGYTCSLYGGTGVKVLHKLLECGIDNLVPSSTCCNCSFERKVKAMEDVGAGWPRAQEWQLRDDWAELRAAYLRTYLCALA